MRTPSRVAFSVALVTAVAVPATAAHAASSGLEGIPHYDHVVVLVEENESESATFGAGSPATYLNGLVKSGAFASNYYGTGHVSLDNYIAMTSGQLGNGLTNSDCLAVNFYMCTQSTSQVGGGRNIGDQLDAASLSWKGYMDGMPSACFHADDSPTAAGPDPYQGDSQTPPAKDYADRHNPFIYYSDIESNVTRCQSNDVPYTQLSTDLAANSLPAFSFITPDTCHDGHDASCSNGDPGGLHSMDAWLGAQVPALLGYLTSHNGLLVITFDEASPTDPGRCPCDPASFGGQIGALFLGPGVRAGQTVTTAYDHYSLLRTIEDSFGISEHLNQAGSATAMSDMFATPSANLPEAPWAALLLVVAAFMIATPHFLARWYSRRVRRKTAS